MGRNSADTPIGREKVEPLHPSEFEKVSDIEAFLIILRNGQSVFLSDTVGECPNLGVRSLARVVSRELPSAEQLGVESDICSLIERKERFLPTPREEAKTDEEATQFCFHICISISVDEALARSDFIFQPGLDALNWSHCLVRNLRMKLLKNLSATFEHA